MLITNLPYFENIPKDLVSVQGGFLDISAPVTPDVILNYDFNQYNAVLVYQTAIATAYNGTAIASTYSSIVVGNSINSSVEL
jgi:hypothetical protein